MRPMRVSGSLAGVIRRPHRLFRSFVCLLALSGAVLYAAGRSHAEDGTAGAAAPEAASPAVGTPSPIAGRCGVCHPAERVAFEKSRHATEGVRCVGCHGGNDGSLEQRIAHGAGFVGKPDKPGVLRLCASCHSDEEKMRAYNLPVDQMALYLTSGHGHALARGNTRVAVCTDCHGHHEILAASDPASTVYRLNVPRTCGRCHSRPADFPEDARMGQVYESYMKSVHARELLDRGNRQAPNCTDCHGVHGAAPPAVGDVGKVCGNCHTAERRYFEAGPHARGFEAAGHAGCMACHDNHLTESSAPDRLLQLCGSCHGEDSAEARTGRDLHDDYAAAVSALDKADHRVRVAEAVPIQVEDYRARLEEGRTYLREAMVASHSVVPDLMMGFTTRSRGVAAEVDHEVAAKLQNLQWRKIFTLLLWLFIVATVILLRYFRDRAPREN